MDINIGYDHKGTYRLSAEERRRHVYVAGKTGTGKSTLLRNMMLSDISDRGFALIDPHGDLAIAVADSIPPERTNDVIYLDPLDPTHVVGFNPLEHIAIEQRPLAAASIVSAFKNIWSDSWGPRMEYILINSVRLLLDVPNATLLHIPRLLSDSSYRNRMLKHCTDPFIRYFWKEEFAAYSERFRLEAIAPVQNKVGQFAANPYLRAILGQKSTIDIDRIINTDKIFIANLSKQVGTEPSHLLGALLTSAFLQAAERRVTIPESERRDFTLYVDEFQNFATDSFATILSEARKWRLNLVLGNQYLGQLPPSLRRAVLGNVGTLVVFRIGSEDAQTLAEELGIPNHLVLTETPNFEAWFKTLRQNLPTDSVQIKTFPPAPPALGRIAKVIERTRSRHARPRVEVDRKISRFFS